MLDSEIYNIIKSLVGHHKEASSRSSRSKVRNLLPIDSAFGYYLSNKVEFYDPIQDEIFYRNLKYDNEKMRLESISYINGRIEYYNRLCDDEFTKNGSVYDYVDPIAKWGVKVKLSDRILHDPAPVNAKVDRETIRVINNEYIYKCALKLDSDQFVERFNKMIYVYLKKISGGKKLMVDNTLYKPTIEYEDWFMSAGLDLDEIKSLADGLRGLKSSENPVNYCKKIEPKKINAAYSIRANPNHQKWYSSPVESKIISLIENGMIDGYVSDCMFKHVNKLNIKKLAHKLNCSDKTAKKFITQHASYLLE